MSLILWVVLNLLSGRDPTWVLFAQTGNGYSVRYGFVARGWSILSFGDARSFDSVVEVSGKGEAKRYVVQAGGDALDDAIAILYDPTSQEVALTRRDRTIGLYSFPESTFWNINGDVVQAICGAHHGSKSHPCPPGRFPEVSTRKRWQKLCELKKDGYGNR
jgi:hypothetical protein